MHSLRTGFVFLLVLLLAPAAHGQAARTVSRTFDLASGGTVTIDAYKGRIDVQTWDRDQARVEVTIKGDEQGPVNKTRIDFDSSPSRLEIETDYDELEDNHKLFGLFSLGSIDRPSTDFSVTLPRTSNVSVDTYSAATTVGALDGDAQFDAYSATLTIDRLTGSLQSDTYSGDVKVNRIGGSLTADSYSGHLEADSIGGSVTFSTYSGAATLTFRSLTADCSFDSFSGDVTVTLPGDVGAVVEANEDALESDLPMRIESISDEKIRGTIGQGGPLLRFDTFSGTLSLRSGAPAGGRNGAQP